jgi:signal peptidase I
MFGYRDDTIPAGEVQLPQTRCPNCGYYRNTDRFNTAKVPVANGDRILVLKCIYQFLNPKRWDVVVFKNPLNPSENYIKRLIGLPDETVEIIDGDIYINGQIARKPMSVQEELWMVVYDNDYQPVNPDQRVFNGYKWEMPLELGQSNWKINKENPTQFYLDSGAEQVNVLTYGKQSANDFKAGYAYNDVRMLNRMPQCSDLMVRFYVQPNSLQGQIGATLSKYGQNYKACADLSGRISILKNSNGKETVLSETEVKPPDLNKPVLFKFANVDHELIFQFGEEKVQCDLGRSPDVMGTERTKTPSAEIFGSGKLTLSHVAIFRDIHYTGEIPQSGRVPRATEHNPFTLKSDEFFVMGDNSPNSEDGRWWDQPDAATKGTKPPRAGIVPRDYLVGKALFVYWPSGFTFPWPQSVRSPTMEKGNENLLIQIMHTLTSLRWIPNVGQMRFIYGGSDSN